MTAETRSRTVKILGFVTATVIPIVAFGARYTRQFNVGARFALHEAGALLTSLVPVLLVVLLVLAAGAYLVARPRVPALSLLARQVAHVVRFTPGLRPAITAAAVLLSVLAVRAEIPRYRWFSEAYYPLAALERARAGDIAAALGACRDYVRLFPQRAPTGPVRDRVCGPLLELAATMASASTYIRAREIAPRNEASLSIPAAWDSRRAALALAGWWSGAAPRPELDVIGESER